MFIFLYTMGSVWHNFKSHLAFLSGQEFRWGLNQLKMKSMFMVGFVQNPI